MIEKVYHSTIPDLSDFYSKDKREIANKEDEYIQLYFKDLDDRANRKRRIRNSLIKQLVHTN